MVGQISRLTILLISSWWLTTPVVSAVSSVVHVVFGSSTVMVVVCGCSNWSPGLFISSVVLCWFLSAVCNWLQFLGCFGHDEAIVMLVGCSAFIAGN